MASPASGSSEKTAKPFTPRVSVVTRFHPVGCRFHVASSAESFRVEKFGGEEEFTTRMLAALRPEDVFFDVGASIGFVALHAALRCRRVFAFEPETRFRTRLMENAALNGLTNVTSIPWAVSDAAGTVELFSDGLAGLSPTLVTAAARPALTIETDTLDHGLATGALQPPQVMKLDIEGAEVRAIRGMAGLLASSAKPREIFIEIHPPMLRSFGDDWGDADAALRAAGYAVTYEQGRFDQIHRVYRA